MVYITLALRTPIGKYGGALKDVRPDDLLAYLLKEVVERSQIEPELIDDVYVGCANQAGEDNRNVARMAVLLAGLPYTIPACTVNRLCGSGLEAVNIAYKSIVSHEADIIIAGGVESMTRAPYVMPKFNEPFKRGNFEVYDTSLGWRFINPKFPYYPYSMGETAENLASLYKISREEQDLFAYDSHRKAIKAIDEGKFKDEIVPVILPDNTIFETDEGPRRDTSLEKLSKLKPVFKKDGTVTAGNSSNLNDGASLLVLVSERKLKELNLKPLARIIGTSVVGVNPDIMGIGPVYAIKKLLNRFNLKLDDVKLFEINEAFAAQILAVLRELPIEEEKLNVNGGAIALGHPLGCSGARILTTLVHELKRRGGGLGIASLCIGVGQGIATLVEVY
ncbi:MAG: thiolase family protein [candidate division WOR-3 bacterium]|nr:thiolase family protein [candidate division WOR-3 bacterium]MCX7947114.1 thiolase family protein [candidate division WOR-3 bacterium]MDW8149845.1 thiolase family protein [candidate division WOR-3 bacterium]